MKNNKVKTNKQDLVEYTKQAMKEYGSFTLQDRAIPELKDGLKPVHRRVLWAAYKGGFNSSGSTKKCARLVGDTIGKFHPQGDSGTYQALVTIAKSANPLLIPQGNFGNKVTDDEPAAMRYTECKLSPFSEKYLLDKDYLAVTPMVPNYDGKDEEPVYFPSKIPVILTQGIEGIATGASTIIPSFSLESVKELTKQTIKSGKCTPQMCLDTLDFKFSEGGEVWADNKELLSFYKTGNAKLTVVPECTYDGSLHAVVMTSFCPRAKLSTILDSALDIEGVSDVQDASGYDKKTKQSSGTRILFYLNKSISKKKADKMVETIQDYYAVSIPYSIMITDREDDGVNVSFRYSNVCDIMQSWSKWRIQFEVKVVKHLVDIEKLKVKKLNYLIWAVDNLKIIFEALKTKDPDGYLVKHGKITQEHAEYILSQQVRKLSKLEGDKLKEDVKQSKAYIKSLLNDIKDKKSVSKRIYKQLNEE